MNKTNETDEGTDDKNLDRWALVVARAMRLAFHRKLWGMLGPFLRAIKERGAVP